MSEYDMPPMSPPQPVVPEPRPCKVCGTPILGGQLYAVVGPKHIYCDPPRRLDLDRLVSAAKSR